MNMRSCFAFLRSLSLAMCENRSEDAINGKETTGISPGQRGFKVKLMKTNSGRHTRTRIRVSMRFLEEDINISMSLVLFLSDVTCTLLRNISASCSMHNSQCIHCASNYSRCVINSDHGHIRLQNNICGCILKGTLNSTATIVQQQYLCRPHELRVPAFTQHE
jgi:hypothetical protein